MTRFGMTERFILLFEAVFLATCALLAIHPSLLSHFKDMFVGIIIAEVGILGAASGFYFGRIARDQERRDREVEQ